MTRQYLTFAAVACACSATLSSTNAQTHIDPAASLVRPTVPLPSDDAVRAMLSDVIDTDKRGVGMVIGLIDAQGTRIISHGLTQKDGGKPVDADSMFEIGSITKTFTGTILADMILRGEVKIEDPVASLLPSGTRVPARGEHQITLASLATHTSGLPRMPTNFEPPDPDKPYTDYTTAQLYEFLARYQLPREPGAEFEYSNIGYGLLGHALATRTGTDYESLVTQRILKPLGMTDTSVVLSDSQRGRLALGHDATLKMVPNWDLPPAFAGAGALRSSVRDMLKYLAAQMSTEVSPLSEAIRESQRLQVDCGDGKTRSLAWGAGEVVKDVQLIAHNGGTGGYHSMLAWDAKTRRGVVILSNCTTDIDDLAISLLEPSIPYVRVRRAIALRPEQIQPLAGVYEIQPGAYREVAVYRDRVFLRRDGQPVREIQAEAELAFFNNEIGFQVRFDAPVAADDRDARCPGLTMIQRDGSSRSERRVDRPGTLNRFAKGIGPEEFDSAAATYRFDGNPRATMTLKRDGERLLAQLTGQQFLEVFPKDRDTLFYLIVDAELIVSRDAAGKPIALTLRQGGTDQRASRAD